MKKYLKTAFVLCAICAVSAVLLAYMNSITAPKIEENERKSVRAALEEVALSMWIGEKVDVSDNNTITYYYRLSKNNQITGYILNLYGNGYGGSINIMASYDTEGKIIAVKMISNSETPGVGKKSEKAGYMDKFIGKGSDTPIPTAKNKLNEVDRAAVSGATMTFNGISKALYTGSEFVKKLGGK